MNEFEVHKFIYSNQLQQEFCKKKKIPLLTEVSGGSWSNICLSLVLDEL